MRRACGNLDFATKINASTFLTLATALERSIFRLANLHCDVILVENGGESVVLINDIVVGKAFHFALRLPHFPKGTTSKVRNERVLDATDVDNAISFELRQRCIRFRVPLSLAIDGGDWWCEKPAMLCLPEL